MTKRKTADEKKRDEWKKEEKKFLGKIRKDRKKNKRKGKEVNKEEVKCFKCQEKGHFMNSCKSKDWVKRKNSKKGKSRERNFEGNDGIERSMGVMGNPEKDCVGKENDESVEIRVEKVREIGITMMEEMGDVFDSDKEMGEMGDVFNSDKEMDEILDF